MSDKPFDAEACNIGRQASATNGCSDMKTPSKRHRVIDPFIVNFPLTPLLGYLLSAIAATISLPTIQQPKMASVFSSVDPILLGDMTFVVNRNELNGR
jgi:hypothetical protein